MIISVIVPVYKQWDQLLHLINDWTFLTVPTNCELIIVDNEAGITPYIAQQQNVIITKCLIPGSYAARNAGLRLARGELILFTDADCRPDKKWLYQIYQTYQDSDKHTLLAGNVVVRSDSYAPNTQELFDMVLGLPQKRYVTKGYAITANLAVPKVVFDEVGLFDEERFSGGDADFCQRALKAGFKLAFVPDAIVYHPARKTWHEYATKVRRMKGGQIRAGKLSRRLKYFFITLIPPVWRIWRTMKSVKLSPAEKLRVVWFQIRLWFVELFEMVALLFGKTPERR